MPSASRLPAVESSGPTVPTVGLEGQSSPMTAVTTAARTTATQMHASKNSTTSASVDGEGEANERGGLAGGAAVGEERVPAGDVGLQLLVQPVEPTGFLLKLLAVPGEG